MVKIKIEHVGGTEQNEDARSDTYQHEAARGYRWRIPLKFLNPFRFLKRPEPDQVVIDDSPVEEEEEQPEDWIHPPFP